MNEPATFSVALHNETATAQLMADLALLVGPTEAARVRVIDIDADPELRRKYASRIPVLTADDDFVCAYRLDKDRVTAYLEAGRSS